MDVAKTSSAQVRAAITDYLTAHPDGTTVTAVVEATGVSRSAVAKNLARMEAEGTALRSTGPAVGRRQPDTWYPASVEEETSSPPEVPAAGTEADTPAGSLRMGEAGPEEKYTEDGATEAPGAEGACAPGPDTAEPGPSAPAPEETPPEEADPNLPASAPAPTPPAPQADTASVPETPRNRVNRTGAWRAAPGELRTMVLTHLQDYPNAEFTAGEVAKVLDRSAGAIHNALVRLTDDGYLEQTCAAPRRYRAAAPTST